MTTTWNLTEKLRKFKQADILVLSVAKSGRTWLRVLLSKYFSLHFDVEMSIGDLYQPVPEMPQLYYSHERWSHIVESSFSQRLFGRYIVPEKVIQQKKIVMLYRDPRDVVVSLFFEKSKRADKKISMDISEFIRDQKYGIGTIIWAMNYWHERFQKHPQCIWNSYEGMKADTYPILKEIIDFMGITPKEDCLQGAIEYSKFENMKKLEASNSFNTKILQPGDAKDPSSYKVREGKVGGYTKHFNETDLAYLDEQMSKLDAFFGYKI